MEYIKELFKSPHEENIYFWIHMSFIKKFPHYFTKFIVLIINRYIILLKILRLKNHYTSMPY
jgi:hypothetical protein